MYNPEKEYIMKLSKLQKQVDVLPLINKLIEVHRRFQEFLDLTTASNLRIEDTDALIEIRQFNISCISKYSDLVAKQAVNILPLTLKSEFHYERITNNNVMWEINNRLAMFSPVYSSALKSKSLNSLTRMIIAQNYEKIIKLQENLIHPISEEGIYVVE